MWGLQANLSSISALLQKQDTTIETILDDNALNQALRIGLPAMHNFLLNPEHMNSLLDIVLCDVEPHTKIPNKTTRTAVTILSTGISSLMGKLIKNEEYKQRIINFPKSEYRSNPKCCGHFYRIIESLARFSAGQFLSEIPDLKDYLINNMNCLGLRDLFLFLSTEFSFFDFQPEIFVELSKSANSKENGFYVLSAMRELLKSKEKIIEDMQQPQVIENLFAIAYNDELSPLTQIEAFNLIQKLSDPLTLNDNQDIPKLVQSESEKYDFTKNRPKNVLAAALKIFSTKNPEILLSIFSYDSMTSLKDGIIHSYDAFSKEDLEQFINQNDLFNKIMDAYRNTKTNYHLTDLIQIIQTKQVTLTDEFKKFIEEEVNKRNEIRNSQYPKTNSPIKVIPITSPSEIIKPKLDSSESDSDSDEVISNHDLDSDDNDNGDDDTHTIALLDYSDDEDEEQTIPVRNPQSPPKQTVSIPQIPKTNSKKEPSSLPKDTRRQSTPNAKKANILLEEISKTNAFKKEVKIQEQKKDTSVDELPLEEEEEYDVEDELIFVNNKPANDEETNLQDSNDQFVIDDEEIIEDPPSKNFLEDNNITVNNQVEKQI